MTAQRIGVIFLYLLISVYGMIVLGLFVHVLQLDKERTWTATFAQKKR